MGVPAESLWRVSMTVGRVPMLADSEEPRLSRFFLTLACRESVQTLGS